MNETNDMGYPKNVVVPRQVLLPFILVTSLFALWGFANDITNPMVSAFKKVHELQNFQAALVQLAFYGGYFTMSLPAAVFIKKYSFKTGILIGLGLYAVGALMFYPAAQNEAFWFFLIALYVLTFGLAFLETTANPFILSMGSEETATRRLNFAQSFNPIGSLAGMVVAQQFILAALQSDDTDASGAVIYDTLPESAKAVVRSADLLVIRNPYVFLGFVVLVILGIFIITKMPKSRGDNKNLDFIGTVGRLIKDKKYYEGVIAQAFYVGAQIMCWTFIFQYAEILGIDNATAVYYNMVAMGMFLAGRFVCTFLLKYLNTGKLLMYLSIAALLLTCGAIFIHGMVGLYCLVGISFCMSLMFPTIYGLALKGMGEDAKFGAAGLVMAIVGGALMPPLQGKILDIGGTGYQDVTILGVPEVNFSFILPLICFVVVAIYGFRSYKVHKS